MQSVENRLTPPLIRAPTGPNSAVSASTGNMVRKPGNPYKVKSMHKTPDHGVATPSAISNMQAIAEENTASSRRTRPSYISKIEQGVTASSKQPSVTLVDSE